MTMTVISVNVGLPREVAEGRATVRTGIFKQPVTGPIAVHRLHLDGDGQADLVHHGGPSKAVYAYAEDHYAWWATRLGRDDLVPGQFGENLTVRGLDETMLCLGDRLRIGEALFAITQPRVPCSKLGLRFGDARLPGVFVAALRPGIYLQVLEEGTLQAGDRVDRVAHGRGALSIRDLFRAFFRANDPDAQALLAKALDVPELSDEWRAHIRQRLDRRAR